MLRRDGGEDKWWVCVPHKVCFVMPKDSGASCEAVQSMLNTLAGKMPSLSIKETKNKKHLHVSYTLMTLNVNKIITIHLTLISKVVTQDKATTTDLTALKKFT